VTAIARRHAWYLEGGVPDTLDGRFAVLATVTALVMTRLERDGRDGDLVSVALTERFVEVMEAEHRELGLGDPTLGKQVRKLVGSLAQRAQLWRDATAGIVNWAVATGQSLYRDEPGEPATAAAASLLRTVWEGLEGSSLEDIREGRIG
jgi:cytochrome b pre-mRNA-processing protein 3